MKRHFICLVCLLAIGAGVVWPAHAQDQGAQLLAAVNVLKQQQAQIADNQAKLDQKLADVTEDIRVARLYMSRGGGKHKPPAPPKK